MSNCRKDNISANCNTNKLFINSIILEVGLFLSKSELNLTKYCYTLYAVVCLCNYNKMLSTLKLELVLKNHRPRRYLCMHILSIKEGRKIPRFIEIDYDMTT